VILDKLKKSVFSWSILSLIVISKCYVKVSSLGVTANLNTKPVNQLLFIH